MDEREARYAEAICAHHCGAPHPSVKALVAVHGREARAAMAVADEEQAELRAEIERLRLQNKEGVKMVRALTDELMAATSRHEALVADLRGLANSKGSGFPYVQTRELRAVLDKHAGDQAQGGEGS